MPIASAVVENNAIAESPASFPLSLNLKSTNAAAITTGSATLSGARFITAATDNAPYPICERPSPIIEYFFNTSVTLKSEEHNVTAIPPIIAGKSIAAINSGVSINLRFSAITLILQ